MAKPTPVPPQVEARARTYARRKHEHNAAVLAHRAALDATKETCAACGREEPRGLFACPDTKRQCERAYSRMEAAERALNRAIYHYMNDKAE